MEGAGSVREHPSKFFDTVVKFGEMDVDINPELLVIMLLYSVLSSSENFRYAIESRDKLLCPETPRIKIIEENDTRCQTSENGFGALFLK